MKHLFFAIAALMAVGTTMAQNVPLFAPSRILTEPNSTHTQRQAPNVISTIPDFSTDAVTAQKIASSANFYTYANTGQKPLSIINDLNAISFIFRNNPNVSGGGNPGHLRYNISSNKGNTWASTTGAGIGNLNPNEPQHARYPNGFLFRDPAIGGTNANVHIGVLAAALNFGNSAWEGYLKGAVAPNVFTNTISPNVEQEDYALFEGPVFPQHITERVPGEFWATMYSDNAANDSIYVLKGTYDAVSEAILWHYQDKLFPAWNITTDGSAKWTMPKIEFSPDGEVGYVVVLGDLIGGQDSAYTPILWEYNAFTSHFTGGYEVNINQFPQLNTFLASFLDSNGQPISNGTPSCAFNYELSVDVNNNLHIMCIIAPAYSGIIGDAKAYSIAGNFGLQVVDITKDYTGSWNMMKLWNQKTFRETATELNPTMNLARTQDGKYLFYTWSDTDTTGNFGNTENNAPNLKTCFYDVVNDKISLVKDWTYNDGTWVGNAQAPKTPNRVFETGTSCPGRSFNIPVTVSEIAGNDPINPTDFFYFSNINYNCGDASETPEWFYTCAMNPIVANPAFVSPACGQNNGTITLAPTGGVGNFTYQISDLAGTSLSSSNTAAGLAAGAYLVEIQDSFGCKINTTLSLNNVNAPISTASNLVFPACLNSNDGQMTVCFTTNATPVSVAWFSNGSSQGSGVSTGNCNTNDTLPSGNIVAIVTDANGCLSSVSGTLGVLSLLSVNGTPTPVSCKDSADGSILLAINNAVGAVSIVWTGPTPIPNGTTHATGLAPGTYTATVSNNGCEIVNTYIITEPEVLSVTIGITQTNTTCSEPYNGIICIANVAGGNSTVIDPNDITWTAVSGDNPYPVMPDPNNPDCVLNVPGGIFTVNISDSKGCPATATIEMLGCQVGIEKNLSNITHFEAFPNPASDVLQVKMRLQKEDNVSISLVNVAGQNVLQKDILHATNLQESFYINGLAKGIYFLKIQTSQGIAAEKIVIE